MDLESECSALESVEDNELIAPEGLEDVGENESTIRNNNGTCHVDDKSGDDTRVKPPSEASPATKGRGLRKWRRIHREFGKEANSYIDSNRKRDFGVLPGDMTQRSDGSVSSTNAMANVVDRSILSGESGLGGAPIFSARADSENSEDHSSRSSTAASAPRTKHEITSVVGLGHNKNRMGSLTGKYSGISVQPGRQKEKGRVETNKKARGVKIEKENSYSSMESDSRSSNFVFVQGTANSMTSNGRQNGRSANYEGEYSDDVQNGDIHSNKEAQTTFSKIEAEDEDVSQEGLAAENSWEVKEENIENPHVGSLDRDALKESIVILHSAQEALEKEVQKLRELGKASDSVDPSESTSVDSQNHVSRPSSSNTWETQMMDLKQSVVQLQSKLVLKESMVSVLDSTLNLGDMASEFEELLKQKLEAEVEYLAISETLQNLRTAPIDEIKLMVQQKTLVSEQVQLVDKLEDEESKGMALKNEACEEDAWKLQKKVGRYASSFMLQLILLLVVVYFFVSQFSSQTLEVVPT